MKILVIGSRGFIGSYLTVALQSLGNVVVESLASVESEAPQGHQVRKIADFFEENKPDICINCSGAANVSNSFSNPRDDFFKNTVSVYEMLVAIKSFSPHTKFVHLSSAAVYGSPISLPIRETAPTIPLSPYGFHKLAAEQSCREFAMLYGLKTVSLRIFSAYGPGLRKQLLWDTFQKWKKSKIIELWGTGKETRDFIYIQDLCSAVIKIIQNAEFNGEAINIASGVSISVCDIVSLLVAELGGDREVRFIGNERTGDPSFWRADINALEQFGFNAQTSIENGVKATAKWQKEQE